jgi:hypothetical protein
MAITRPIWNRNYLPTTMLICDISGFLACTLLVLVLLPPIGWFLLFLCAFSFLRVLYGSYRQIFEFLCAFTIQLCSTLKQVLNPPHQASNNNSMEQKGNGGVPTMAWIVKPSTISVYFSCCFVVVRCTTVVSFLDRYYCCILHVTYCIYNILFPM